MKRKPKRASKTAVDTSWESFLVERLKKPEFAVEFLNVALEDTDEGCEERFLMALRHVAQAHGMTAVAKRAGMARQAMYRALSAQGNPELFSLRAVLSAIGLKLSVEPKKKGKTKAS